MRLNYDAWTDSEVFNCLQILMIAKFDSAKSYLLLGQPLLSDLMREIIEGQVT